jgi:Acetyltransferase (GNAT) domain
MQKTAPEMLVLANPADSERWNALVSNSPMPDVYYLPGYACATSEIERSEPVAIVAGPDSGRFLAPLLLRSMSTVVNDTNIEWTDACSPYGYGGLLHLSNGQPTHDELRCFFDDLHDWCSARDVVCCVLRLHPLMRQEEWFASMGQREKLLRIQLRGSTTAIDLEHWDDVEDRPFGMRKGRRSDLNVARRMLRVTWTSGDDDDLETNLDRFRAIYSPAMERHRGDHFYRFPPSYFSRLASLGTHLGIASAWQDDKLAGASIFLAGRDFAHYHLACANEIGMKHKAATMLVVDGARWARKQGCKLLHLGGGLNPGDSLEDFKCSFGGQPYRYAYLMHVADPVRFEQLCQMQNAPWPYRVNGMNSQPLDKST